MTTYFEHCASKGRAKDVQLDVVEWDVDVIDVKARTFESREALAAHVAREMETPARE